LGDHLRKKRLDLKLLQKDVAQRFGVDETTIHNWETGHTTPSLPIIPKLIAFWGYIPFEMPAKRNLGQRVKAHRRVLGLRRKDLAEQIKIDPSTLARWEIGEGKASKELLKKVSRFLDSFSRAALNAKGQPIGRN